MATDPRNAPAENLVKSHRGQQGPMLIRPAAEADADSIWQILEPVLRAGETYALPHEWTRTQALAYWRSPGHEVFVAEKAGTVVGTYYLRPNQRGGGGHVANCAYMTSVAARGHGIGRAMGLHSLRRAAANGYTAMQFNFVVSSNENAVALWKSLGFAVVGTLPAAFRHPRLGLVDAFVMYRALDGVGY
jgi:ribosomal protein S18 acetylase RimI-like enzyme